MSPEIEEASLNMNGAYPSKLAPGYMDRSKYDHTRAIITISIWNVIGSHKVDGVYQ